MPLLLFLFCRDFLGAEAVAHPRALIPSRIQVQLSMISVRFVPAMCLTCFDLAVASYFPSLPPSATPTLCSRGALPPPSLLCPRLPSSCVITGQTLVFIHLGCTQSSHADASCVSREEATPLAPTVTESWCEIKAKAPQSWYKLYEDGGCLPLIWRVQSAVSEPTLRGLSAPQRLTWLPLP